MKLEDIIQRLTRETDLRDPKNSHLIEQLFELQASLSDKELNNQLLQKLVAKYTQVERQLVNTNEALLQKNEQVQNALAERNQAFNRLEIEQKKTKELAALLQKMFGRYLSPDVMKAIIEDPTSLELGGEKRNVTLLMSDLRGFTALCERLKPEQVVRLLNGYCKYMMEVIDKYHGTVNEIIGDSLLVIFGAPKDMPDRTQLAVACAIEMQNTMAQVNSYNQSFGLPAIEMGIGLNETEVIVGNIGSDKRSKYGVVGSGVNLTSRIESYTIGGQVLISETVYKKLGSLLRINEQRVVYPKGSEIPLTVYEVLAIAEPWNRSLKPESSMRIDLVDPIQIECRVIKNKAVKSEVFKGSVVQLSKNDFQINLHRKIDNFTDLQMNLVSFDGKLPSKPFYGKVISSSDENNKTHTVKFTSLPPEIANFFKSLHLGH